MAGYISSLFHFTSPFLVPLNTTKARCLLSPVCYLYQHRHFSFPFSIPSESAAGAGAGAALGLRKVQGERGKKRLSASQTKRDSFRVNSISREKKKEEISIPRNTACLNSHTRTRKPRKEFDRHRRNPRSNIPQRNSADIHISSNSEPPYSLYEFQF